VVAADTTSINLYKALSAALSIARQQDGTRRVVVSERSNFPTDLYIAEALCRERGCTLKLIEPHEVLQSLQPDVAVLMLTQVNYRTGALHDMAHITAAAHAAGVLTVWDLCHSAGAVPVDLTGADADLAVGCTYKYFNGGPGSPAFVWVHPRHVARCWQPLAGWWGMRRRSTSRPSTSRPWTSRATSAARSRSSAWPHWMRRWTCSTPPPAWAAWPRCVPSRCS
jgi:kynureninase